MPQRVRGGRFVDAGRDDRFLHRALQQLFVQMMTPFNAAARIDRVTSRSKQILPGPGCACPRVLSLQRVRQIDARLADPQIILEEQLPLLQVLAQITSIKRIPVP